MIGAHLDSWQGGTGATDNAAGCAVMIEALADSEDAQSAHGSHGSHGPVERGRGGSARLARLCDRTFRRIAKT